MTISRAPLSPMPSAQLDHAIEVTRVTTGVDTDRFIKFQWEVYRRANDLHWVPPLIMERRDFLDPKKNPFYQHADVALFLARRGDAIVGRIAAIEDRNFNAFHGRKTAYFGLYESVNDPAVTASLFAAAKDWARWRGLDTLLGPMNLSTNYEVGLLVEGFDSDPYILMPYNPRYYPDLFERCGLKKAKDLLAWERSAATPPPEHFGRIADKIRQETGITIRSPNMRDFDAEVARVKQVYNAAYEKNWGFVPLTEAEFDKLASDLRQNLVPDLTLIAEDHGEPIGFSLTLPDFNQALKRIDGRLTSYGLPIGLLKLLWYRRKVDRVRQVAQSVKSGWRRRGIDAVLVVETLRRARARGYLGGEISWTLEDNDVIKSSIEAAGCTLSKRYRVYEIATG